MIPDLYKYAGGESLDDKKKREAEERGVESAKKALTAKPKTEKTAQAKPGKPKPGKPKPPAKPEFDTSVFEAKESAGSPFDQPLNFYRAWGVKPPSGSLAAQTMRGDADRANMLFGAGAPSQAPDQPDDPFGQSFTRTSDSLFEQIGIKPQSFTQIRQKEPGTLEHAMAVYDMLEYGRPTFGYKTGDKEADKKRNQFMSSILTGSNIRLNESKNPESFDGVYLPTLTTSLYAKAKEKLGEDGAMEFLSNTGLIPRGQIIDTSEWGEEAKSDARMMLSGAVPGIDPRTGKKAFYNAPESAKGKGLSPMGFVGSFPKESEYGGLPLATLQQSEANIPKFTPGDLNDAGVTGAQKAILKDDPFFGEHDSAYRTYVDAVQGVVNPFTTVTQLSGQATSDLPTPARLGILAGDFVFQLAVGELAGGEIAGAAKAGRTFETVAKLFTVDNLMDLPDYLQAVDNDGFQKGTAEFVVGLANQFNPGVLLDPNTSPDEKMITFLSLATMGAGSAYSKIKNSQYAKRAMSVPPLDEIVSRGGLDALPAAVQSEATKFADQMYVLSGGVPGSKSGPDLILRDLADQAATVHAAQLYHIYQSPKMVGEALESMLPSPEDAITSKAMAIAALDMAQQRSDARARGADFEAMKGWPKVGDPGQVEAQSQEVVSIANEATQAILTGNEESISPPAERVVKEIKKIYSGVDLVDNWDFKPDAKPIKPGESSRDAGAMFDHEKPGTALAADLRHMYEDDFDGLPDIADIEREFDLVDVTTNKTTGEKSLFIRDKSGLITNVGPLDGNINWDQAYKNHIEARAKEIAKAKITDAKQYVDAVSDIPFLADSSIMKPEQSKAQFMAIVDDAVQKIAKSGWTVDEAMGHIGEQFHHYFDDLDFEIEPEKMFPGLKGAVEELAGIKKDKSHVDSNGKEWKHIGTNAYGNDLFEDSNGVRKVLRDGVYSTEKVMLRPTREGIKIEVERKDGAPLDNDFRTVEEGELIDEPSAPAPKEESKPEPAPKGDTESPEQSGQDGNTIGGESDGRTDQRDQASSSQTGEQEPAGDQGLSNPEVREEGGNGEAGGSGRTPSGRRPKPNGVADGKQDGAGDGQERGDHGDAPVSGRPEPGGRGSGDAGRRNFRYGSPDEVLRQQSLGVAERRDVAIDAITALREASRNGFATPEQQAAMAAFPGWGLIKTYIHKDNKSAGAKKLKALLTPEEYIAAANASINAHYTSPQAIGAMWEAVRNLGFTGGSVLEPSAGSGLFYSLMPEDLHASSTMGLVELDQTTAGMLKFVFPESDVQAKGYEKTRLTPDKYDLVISNVPFARTKIMDAALLRLMGPEAFSHIEMSVHNFFIAKSLVQTKPGGLVAVITTAGTMDAPSSEGFRSWLAENADLLGAIRLPNNAFDASAKTEVVTDILFLRKKGNPDLPESKAKFAKSTVRDIGGHPQYVNEYFQKNPQNILGVESSRGTMYGPNSYTVEGNPESDLAEELPKAIRSAIGKQRIAPIDAATPTQSYRFAEESRRVNEIYKNSDGQIVQKTIDGVEEPLEFPNTKAGKDSKALWTDYLALKSAVEDVLSKQEAGTDSELVSAQKAAIEIHRKFVAKHGNLYENKTTESRRELTAKAIDKLRESGDLETAVMYGEIDEEGGKYFRTIETIRWKNTPTLSRDSLWAKVYSIEKFDYDSKSVVGYGQPFTKRVSTSQIEMKADSPQDAVQLSYNIKGKFDLEFISEMLGIDGDAAVKALGDAVFKTPEGEYVDSTEYLSGNVRLKLNQAKEAYENGDQSMARNIKALEDAQPPRKEFADISFRMGATFVPVDVYKKFFDAAGINLDLNKSAFGFKVRFNYANEAAQSRFAPGQVELDKVIRAAMEQRGVGPQYVTVGGEKVRSMELEEAMNAAVENLVGSFMEYIKIDSESQKAIADAFNEEVNVWQKSVIDGSGLRFPGLSNHVEIRPHSTSAIARAMRNRATYWWHGVGSGKTYTGVMLSLKMKQTGLRNKPMFVAYKPTLTQVAEHYYSAYPNANILVAADDSFSPQKREMFLAQIAAGDWDAVVVTQEQFNTVKLSAQATKDYYMALMRQTLEDYEVDGLDYGDSIGQMSDRQIKDAVKKTGEDRQTQRQMVNEIKRIQDAMDKAVANLQGYDIVVRKIKGADGRTETVRDIVPLEKAVSGIDWSMLGVDHVILDEAHMYKGLPIATKKQIAHSSSQRAEGFNMIAQSLATTGGGLTMMSGTALVNSFAETYVILKYLMPDTLAKMGLGHFDTWASTYTKIEAKPEVTVDGKVKIKDRVTEFNNIDELASLLEQVVDIVPTSSIPEIVLPDTEDEHGTKTTKPIVIEVEPTETQKTLFQEIGRRFLVAKKESRLPPEERTEFVLALSTLSRQLSQDARLVASKFSPEFQAMASSDQPRKIEAMIDRSVELYKKHYSDIGTQILFVEWGIPGGASDINLYADLKRRLVAAGVKPEEVKLISDVKTNRDRKIVNEGMNSGKIRFLIGSRPKLGVGMNVQKHLKAVHHMDIGWNPANIEQGNGRIIRFGNKWKQVQIYYYVTKGTFDQVTGQKTLQKGNIISQLMNALSGRLTGLKTLEAEPGEDMVGFGEILASSMGDRRIIDLINAGAQLKKANLQSSQFESGKMIAESRVPAIESGELPRVKRLAEMSQKVAEEYDPTAPVKPAAFSDIKGETPLEMFEDAASRTFEAAKNSRSLSLSLMFGNGFKIQFASSYQQAAWEGARSGYRVLVTISDSNGTVLDSGDVWTETSKGEAIPYNESQILWAQVGAATRVYNAGRFSGRALASFVESYKTPQVQALHYANRLATLQKELELFKAELSKPNPHLGASAELEKTVTRLEFETGFSLSSINNPSSDGESMFGAKPTTVSLASGTVQIDIPDPETGRPSGETRSAKVLEKNSKGWLWVEFDDGTLGHLANYGNPDSNQGSSTPEIQDGADSHAGSDYQLSQADWEGLTADEISKVAKSLEVVARGAGIPTQIEGISKSAKGVLGLYASGTVKFPKGRIRTARGLRETILAGVLAHEIGHSIDAAVSQKAKGGRVKTTGDLKLLLPEVDPDVAKAELIEVTKHLVGKAEFDRDSTYYKSNKELFARLIEGMLRAPSATERLAPESSRAVGNYILENPFVRDTFLAASGSLKNNQPFIFAPDARQHYIKALGPYLGEKAYTNEIVYQKNRLKQIEYAAQLIKEKSKGVKDRPEDLFNAAEGIFSNINGEIRFGTRDYKYLDPSKESYPFDAGYLDNEGWWPEEETVDGKERWAKWRWTEVEAKANFQKLSPEGKALILEFTADAGEAKDVFNRELLRLEAGIQSSVEGWVHHFHEGSPFNPRGGTRRLKKMVAGARRNRSGADGYSTDFWKASQKAITDLLVEAEQNRFVADQSAAMMEFVPPNGEIKRGYTSVAGNIVQGFFNDGDVKVLVPDKTGKLSAIKPGATYQIPTVLWERHLKARAEIKEVGLAMKALNGVAQYWTVNTLIHPATWATNFISGGIQFALKMQADFILDTLNYQGRRNRTVSNAKAILATLTPKGWDAAPGYMYGDYHTMAVSTYMGFDEPGIGRKVSNIALWPMQKVEEYWKKVVVNAEQFANTSKTGNKKWHTDPESKEFYEVLARQLDLYTLNYDNVPPWMEAWTRNPVGTLVKPYSKYAYKYMKTVASHLGAAFDPNLDWQTRVARSLSLGIMIMALYALRQKQSEETDTDLDVNPVPEDVDLDKLSKVVDTRGRLFVGKNGRGNDVYMRTAKYPFMNITDTLWSLAHGNPGGAVDVFRDFAGGLGPGGTGILDVLGFNSEYDKYTPPEVRWAGTATSFIPAHRLVKDTANILDPVNRKSPKTWQQEFGMYWPTTDAEWLNKYRPEERTYRIPFTESELARIKTARQAQREGWATPSQLELLKRSNQGTRETYDDAAPKDKLGLGLRLGVGLTTNEVNPDWQKRFIERLGHNAKLAKEKEAKAKR